MKNTEMSVALNSLFMSEYEKGKHITANRKDFISRHGLVKAKKVRNKQSREVTVINGVKFGSCVGYDELHWLDGDSVFGFLQASLAKGRVNP